MAAASRLRAATRAADSEVLAFKEYKRRVRELQQQTQEVRRSHAHRAVEQINPTPARPSLKVLKGC